MRRRTGGGGGGGGGGGEDGHGRAVKYPGMKIPYPSERKWEERKIKQISSDVFTGWGMAQRPELQESVTGCRPAGRGINLNGITPLLLFLLLLLLHLLFFILRSFSLAACLFLPTSLSLSPWLIPPVCQALQTREQLLHGSEEHRFALIGDFTGLLHIRVLFFCINYILKRHQG